MLSNALTTSLGTEIGPRKRKNSGNINNPGGAHDSSSVYGRHVLQHQIPSVPNRSQNRRDSEVDWNWNGNGNGNGDQAERPAVG